MALDPGPVKAGQALTARLLGSLGRLLASAVLRPEAPLEFEPGGGPTLRLAKGRPIVARLTAAGPTAGAYSWAEAYASGPATWQALVGGRSGVGTAFEANLASDLPVGASGGAVVELLPGFGGQDWRFQFLRYGSGLPSCPFPSTLNVCVTPSCCCPMSDTLNFTFTVGATTIATAAATASITEAFDGTNYTQSVTSACVSIPTTLPVGTVVNWTAVGAIVGTLSGSLTVACGPTGAGVLWYWVDTLPDTIHVTDPDGNAVPLTRGGAVGTTAGRTWSGSWTYTRTDTLGVAHSVTVGYSWSSEFVAGAPCGALTIDGTPLYLVTKQNYCTRNYDGTNPPIGTYLGLPDWVAPGGPSKSCFPLAMAYTAWPDDLAKGGFGGHFDKQSTCWCNNTLVNKRTLFSGATYQVFPCGSTWTVTL